VSEAYASKLLNGTAGNYELKTMVKWARAVGGIVQVRVIKEEGEVVRVVDYETAGEIDDKRLVASDRVQPSGGDEGGKVLAFQVDGFRDRPARRRSPTLEAITPKHELPIGMPEAADG